MSGNKPNQLTGTQHCAGGAGASPFRAAEIPVLSSVWCGTVIFLPYRNSHLRQQPSECLFSQKPLRVSADLDGEGGPGVLAGFSLSSQLE